VRLVGTVARSAVDSFVLLVDGAERSVPVRGVVSIEVSRIGRRTGRGALIGAIAGGVVGFLTGTIACRDYACAPGDVPVTEILTGGGVLVGALVGAGIGSTRRVERWDECRCPDCAWECSR
jgi:hypothetical protein